MFATLVQSGWAVARSGNASEPDADHAAEGDHQQRVDGLRQQPPHGPRRHPGRRGRGQRGRRGHAGGWGSVALSFQKQRHRIC